MDLGQIEFWTRQALEAEATRRGIRDPHLRSQRGLIRELLRHEFAQPIARSRRRVAKGLLALEQARELLGAASMMASAVMPGLRSLWGLDRQGGGADQVAADWAQEVETTRHPPASQSRASHLDSPAEADGDAAEGRQAGRQEEDHDKPRRFSLKTPRTLAMARILAAQGHVEHALDVYAALCAANTLDPVPRWEARVLRETGALPDFVASPLPAAPPAVQGEDDDSSGGSSGVAAFQLPHEDAIEWCVEPDGRGAVVRWSVSDAGQDRARALLGEAGEIALRLFVVRPDSRTVVSSDVEEYGPVEASGQRRLGSPVEPGRRFAAVGLRAAQRFVPITYAAVAQAH